MGIVAKGYISPYTNKKEYDEQLKKFNQAEQDYRKRRQQEENAKSWINTSAFQNINNPLDFLMVTGATLGDIGLDLLHSGLNVAEGIADTGQYLLADITEGFGLWGENDISRAIRKNADFNSFGAWFGENEEGQNLLPKGWQEGIEENSILGGKSDQVVQSIGQIGGYALTGGVLGGGVAANNVVIFSSAYGNAKSEAKRNGASESDAIKKALVSATAETISENLFDAMPFVKSSGFGDKVIGKFFNKKVGKVTGAILNSFEEGSEEIISNLLDVAGTYAIDYIDKATGGKGWEYGMQNLSGDIKKDLKDTFMSEETWEAFFSAALSTALVGTGHTAISNTRMNNAINSYAKENNVSKEQARKDFETVLGGVVEEYKTNDISVKEQYELENQLKGQLSKSVKQGLNLSEAAKSVRTDQENQNYKFEFTQGELKTYKDNKVAQNIMEKVQNSDINNTKKAHEIVKTAIKVAEELNVNVDFTNNNEITQQLIKNRQQELGRELTDKEKIELEKYASQINGMKLGNNILLNTDSKQSAKYTLGHEMKHFLEQNSKLNEELNEKLIEWAKTKGVYDTDFANMSTLYKQVQNANVIDELTANYTGEFFSSEENIRAFATENPGLFTKIANYFKKLYYKATNQQEKLLIQEINEKIQKVYSEVSKERKNLSVDRSSKVDMNGDAKLSIDTDSNGNKYVKVDTDQDIFDGVEPKDYNKIAKMYITDYLLGETKLSNKDKALIDTTGRNKYTNPGQKQRYFGEKMKLTPELKNVLEIAQKDGNKSKYKNNATYDNYEYYKFNFEINGNRFEGILNIGIDENGNKHFYEVNNIKKVEGISSVSTNHPSTSNNNISQTKENVKSNVNLPLAEQLERQGTKILEEAENKRQGMIENFKEYLEENDITNPTQEDIDNSLTDILGYDNDEFSDNAKNEKLYNQYVREYMKENGIPFNDKKTETSKFSLSAGEANTGKDNQGADVSIGMQNYMSDSKATDENGNIIRVYHTTTDKVAQFNEFNPVGTDYYKFGDQVVNYFTDDKNMSGSYADQHYKMADTKKLTTMEDVNNYLKQYNESFNTLENSSGNANYIVKEENGKYNVYNEVEKEIINSAENFINTLNEEEKQFIKKYIQDGASKILFEDRYGFTKEQEKYIKKYEDWVFNQYSPKSLSHAPQNYLAMLLMNTYTNKPVATYNNKEQLFKNIKTDLEINNYDKRNRLQYEGYVNITNPYIIDAEGRNWNKVESKKDSIATTKLLSLDTLTKDRLSQLAKDSKKRYNEVYKEHQKWFDAVNSISGSLREENSLQVRLGSRFISESTLPFVKEFANDDYNFEELEKKEKGLGKTHQWRVNNDVMYNLYNNDFISYKMYDDFVKTLVVPEEARNKTKEILNQLATYNEYDLEGHNPEKKQAKLLDIWEKHLESYKAYENNGRYDYSLFDSELLDGYLKDELEDLFPIREPGIGINYDYLKNLYKSASHDFDENYIRLEYNDWSVTNDIVKSIIELNKVGENYDGIIIKNVVDYGGESDVHEAHDLYITFNSNQFKAIDNENPTEDADIRYQMGQQTDILQDKDKTSFEDIKIGANKKLPIAEELNLPTVEKMNKVTPKVRTPKEEAEKRVRDKVKKAIENQSYKAVNIATKTGQNYLDFDRTQKAEFKETLSKYIGKTQQQLTNAKTWNDIKELVSNYANKEITYVDEELKSIKNEIRKQNIKVTEDLKNQITDYGDFRRSVFGKLKLGDTGTSVDSLYQELSEQYPYYFGEATTQQDMLYEIADFMNQDVNTVQKFRLDDATIDEAVTKTYNALMRNAMTKDSVEELTAKLEAKMNERTRTVIQEELLNDMGVTLQDISKGKDIKAIDMFRTDPIRLNEKVFGYEIGNKINDATIRKTKHSEAEKIRFLNKVSNEIKELGIKARSKESAAVQKYAEKEYINDYGEVVKYGDAELAKEFSDTKTQEKIKKAAQVIRQKYDSTLDKVNAALVDMGYQPIPKRENYMPHFQAFNDVLSKIGFPINKQTLSNDALPTDINGITDQFKPGKQWFSNALQRKGMKTEYDAITGFDKYIEGASNLIYHTEDIQRYRALAKLIRNTYGTTHGYDDFATMTPEQQAQRIEDIQSNKLAKYAAWLDEQANALAGKKGQVDRFAERVVGRKVYNVLDAAKKQVGSNMTGYNVRSALTNFASAVQGASKTNKLAWIKGTISTINNIIHDDGLIDKSDFLTSRLRNDTQLSKKLWQKASAAGQIFMSGTDYFTANQIWRSKYYENLQKGMTENEAIKQADDFAARIMGDRSKGATAEAFNSKTLGFFTQFQLEVNNQWSSLIHDNKMDIKNGTKTYGGMLFQTGQLFGLSWMFNNIMKALTGSSVMLDPIDLFKKIFAPDDDDDKTAEERAKEALDNLVDNLPFASVLTPMIGVGSGGRIPISESFKGLKSIPGVILGNEKDNYGNEMSREDSLKNLLESSLYWLLPTGYGQIRKTTKGLGMYNENLPLYGSYTKSGRLRFEAEDTPAARIQAALFGEYASQNAREYLDKGLSPLTENQIQEVVDTGLKVKDYRKYKEGLKEQESTEQKVDYIANLPYSTEQKNILVNNVLNRKEDIDLTNYNQYGSLAEFDYATNNPEKYAAIKQITSYDKYLEYQNGINNIKSQYSDTNTRKAAVRKYINSLKLNKYQKVMLEKLAGGYSIKSYENEMFNYINGLNMTKKEKETLHKQLFG